MKIFELDKSGRTIISDEDLLAQISGASENALKFDNKVNSSCDNYRDCVGSINSGLCINWDCDPRKER